MNISAKFNKKQSNECSDISVKNTNVNFLLHTKSSHLFLHNREKKYSQHVVLLGQRKHLSMFEKYFPNRSVCRSWLQSRPNNMLSLSDLHVFTGCQLTNQNCCSCLQGEIDTCRSASIRGYIIRGSSVSFKVWDMTVFEDGEVGAGLSQRHSYSKHTDHTVHGAVLPPDSTAPWKPTDKQRKLLQIIHEIHVFMIPFINQFCGQVIQ